MSRDRITRIRIRNLRVIEEITLELDGLKVLIGDNGSGKSTILEAFEILRLAATPGIRFPQDLRVPFGPIEELIRHGSEELALQVTIEGGLQRLVYSFTVALQGQRDGAVVQELLTSQDPAGFGEAFPLVTRDGNSAAVFGGGPAHASLEEALENVMTGTFPIPGNKLVLSSFDEVPPPVALRRVRDALLRIELHLPFEARPSWQQTELGLRTGARWHNELAVTEKVARFGTNLPNCYHELRNRGQETWERVLDRARLALGHSLRDFVFPPSGRGYIEMEAVHADKPRNLSTRGMSEGQLSFLLLIALIELDSSRSVLAFDEPEVHLHPALLVNALYLLEKAAENCPVLIATHSDRLLDAIEDPVKSVYLCELDPNRALRLLRPDRQKLDSWLETYRGLGSLRAEGYDFAVFDPDRLEQEGRK